MAFTTVRLKMEHTMYADKYAVRKHIRVIIGKVHSFQLIMFMIKTMIYWNAITYKTYDESGDIVPCTPDFCILDIFKYH